MAKDKIMDISETIVVCDVKVDRCSYLNEYINIMNVKSQGHSLTLVQGHFQHFFLETIRPIEAKFQMEPSWDRETKVCSNSPGHMNNVPAIPICDKNLKNLLLRNQKVYDLETWCVALGACVLQNLFK